MEKTILRIFVSLFLLNHSAYAQDHQKIFEITLPEEKVFYSSYRTITLVDAREDSTQFGRVQTGALNRQAKVAVKIPLAEQLNQVMGAIIDASAGQGELLLELRQFRFAENTGASSEKGFCTLRANLYTKEEDAFHLLASIDTLVVFKSMDVTNGLLRLGGKLLTGFLAENMKNRDFAEKGYSQEEIRNLKIIEKQSIPLYQATKYTDGFYKDYTSFKMQVPDAQIQVKKDNFHNIKFVKVQDASGSFTKVDSEDGYGVVYEGQAYIATKFGYYPVIKKDNELYFQGKTDLAASRGNNSAVVPMLLFGIAGWAMVAFGHSYFEMRINHETGQFIPIRPINK